MKTMCLILSLFLASSTFYACKNNDATKPGEERIDANHPDETDSRYRDTIDTTSTSQDTMMDPNMQGQSDTPGRDTDAGK